MKNQAKKAIQKRNKIKSTIYPGGQTVIVLDDDEVEPKVKKKKKKKGKRLEKEKAADEGRTKKKKHSNLKKGCADYPLGVESSSDLRSLKEAEKIIIESSSDSESRKETGKACKIFKKKGQGKQGGTRNVPNEDQSEAFEEIHSLSRKISKRTVLVSDGDDQDFAPKKKKKRKHQPDCEDSGDKSQKPFSKRPKLTTQEGELLREHKRGPVFPNTTRDCEVVKKKHKGSCSLASVDGQGSRNGIEGDGKARTVSRLKQESGCQERALSCGQHHENGADNETIQKKEKKKKKKKRKENLEAEDVVLLADHEGGDSENGGIEDIPNLDLERGGHVKKKKKMRTQSENVCPINVEDIRGPTSGKEAPVERVKKKKKKAKKDRGVQVHNNHCGFMEDLSELCVEKDTKTKSSKEELIWKKIKVEKEEAKEEEEEIQVVTIKEGNCDEISIDMLRRQALQDEIDQESGKTKAAKEEGELDAHFGQWSTATFESMERKNKFLRLLGSFKSGSASTRNSPAHTSKPNMALPRTGEKRLLQNLQAEFDKARDLKQFRGVGLGFQPTTPKCMYIDKNASNSIKFES